MYNHVPNSDLVIETPPLLFLSLYSNYNESIVHSSMRFFMEQRQLEQRLRLDLPTLSDANVRDLLHESDLFVRSFTGLGFGFGLFSPCHGKRGDEIRQMHEMVFSEFEAILLKESNEVGLRRRMGGSLCP